MTLLIGDKLRIFVSSTLKECGGERHEAKRAITSLNHIPVMFEGFGARPHAPRAMYQRGIEESEIFIGIYRSRYGWIAPDMQISGLEDEYRIATDKGIPSLIYVFGETTGRDSELAELISEIKLAGGVTVAEYSNRDELYGRIRDDVTATISERFLAASRAGLFETQSPIHVLESVLPNPGHRLRRVEIERIVQERIARDGAVVICGPLGCGKSIFLTMMAADATDWIYISAGDYSPKELFGHATNALRRALGKPQLAFTDAKEARQRLADTWRNIPSVTLVVDGFYDVDQLLEVLAEGGGLDGQKRLVASSREHRAAIQQYLYDLPPLNQREIKWLVTGIRGTPPTDAELSELILRSDGNPLYLRYYASGPAGAFETQLRGYELREWKALPPPARELLSYIVLAGQPLSLVALTTLAGGQTGSVEETASTLATAAHLLRTSDSFYDIFHRHLQDTLLELIVSSPPQHRFYAARLGDYFYKEGDVVSAFLTLDRAGDARARKMINEALFAAVVRGDISKGSVIAARQLALAKERDDSGRRVETLLTLALLNQQAGRASEALAALSEAEVAVVGLPAPWQRFVRERRLSLELAATGSREALENLIALRESYKRGGETFGAGRVSVELSAALIRLSRHSEAAGYAREALDFLSSVGDEYGIGLAKANLATALEMVPGHESEAARLFEELAEGADPEVSPRKRALVCNILTRRHREHGNLNLAKEYANEAISIGEQLGDQYLVAINRINLGNALRQAGESDLALEQYVLTDRTASVGGFRELEAHTNDLIANVFNRKGDYARALHHATYALAIARETPNARRLSSSYKEQAVALNGLRRPRDAALAYIEAARALGPLREVVEEFVDLLRLGIAILADHRELDTIVDRLESVLLHDDANVPARRGPTPLDSLFNHFPYIIRRLPVGRVVPITGIMLRIALEQIPKPLVRHAVMKLVSSLLKEGDTLNNHAAVLLALGTLLAACPREVLRLEDIVNIAEQVTGAIVGLRFKPRGDGASHWTVRLELATPVICTIDQFDDRVDIGLACMILAFWLRGLQSEVQSKILLVRDLPRTEVSLIVINVGELARHADISAIGLTLPMESVCEVSRSTDPLAEHQPPIVAICRDDLSESWLAGRGQVSSLQALFALALSEALFHLMKGSIDLETLRPKILSIVRNTIF